MKLAFLFALCIWVVACSQPQPIPTPLIPTQTNVPSTTATPTVSDTPTRSPFPTRTPIPLADLYLKNPKLITDPELAAAYSHNLLILRGYEQGFSYDNALYTPVKFPDGSQGIFVAIGYSGGTRGYKLLYRIEKTEFRLIDLSLDDYDWGMNWGDNRVPAQKVDLKFPELIYGKDGKPERLIELYGSGHFGVGFFKVGHEIVRATDKGLKTIFSDKQLYVVYDYPGDYDEYSYRFDDLDADGIKEIIKDGNECNWIENPDYSRQKINCKSIHEIYKYNGDIYVKQP